MKNYQNTTLEEWKVMGEQSKKVRAELFNLLEVTSGKVPVKVALYLIKTLDNLDYFRNEAEEHMMKTKTSTDVTIFYGKKF